MFSTPRDEDERNDRAILRQMKLQTGGVILIVLGMLAAAGNLDALRGPFALTVARMIFALIFLTIAYLLYRWNLGEPMHRTLFICGVAWFGLGFWLHLR